MTLYLHIGVGKTGTSSIQEFLHMNRAALPDHGFLVPASLDSRNHRALAMHALDDDVIDNPRRSARLTTPAALAAFRTRLETALVAEAQTWPAHLAVVMSAEQMTHVRRPSEFARLKGLLDRLGRPVKIVVYLRRQDLFYTSSYSQSVKGGRDIDMVPTPQKAANAICNYGRYLPPWAATFGRENMILRPYERGQLRDGDVVADFAETIGMTGAAALPRPQQQNLSLDIHTIAYLRHLGDAFPRYVGGKRNKARVRLVAALERVSDGPKPRLAPEVARSFLEFFAESNAEIARSYLGRADGRLFFEDVAENDGIGQELTVTKALDITRKLLPKEKPLRRALGQAGGAAIPLEQMMAVAASVLKGRI